MGKTGQQSPAQERSWAARALSEPGMSLLRPDKGKYSGRWKGRTGITKSKEYPQQVNSCTHWASPPSVSLSPVSVCSSLCSHSPSHSSKRHQHSCRLLCHEIPIRSSPSHQHQTFRNQEFCKESAGRQQGTPGFAACIRLMGVQWRSMSLLDTFSLVTQTT